MTRQDSKDSAEQRLSVERKRPPVRWLSEGGLFAFKAEGFSAESIMLCGVVASSARHAERDGNT
jgi:hypothetical protein